MIRENPYKNPEGYSDTTAGKAIENIVREERQQDAERIQTIKTLMSIIRQATDLAGMEIVGRITFRDKSTSKEYR